jgi:hypothetical protein
VLWALAAAAAAAAALALFVSGHAAALQAYLMAGPLGRSGLLAAFCLIFLSELGDKTFFIAALLAMRLGRAVSFLGSVAALAAMTLISVGIGAACSKLPESLQSSVPVGELAGVALLVFFGIKALLVRGVASRGVAWRGVACAGGWGTPVRARVAACGGRRRQAARNVDGLAPRAALTAATAVCPTRRPHHRLRATQGRARPAQVRTSWRTQRRRWQRQPAAGASAAVATRQRVAAGAGSISRGGRVSRRRRGV